MVSSNGVCNLKLDGFEGPLDLLLHLIEKHKVAINEVSLVAVADQYIEYLSSMERFDIEVASEFLLMAATLIKIKSQSLLPPKRRSDEQEELVDNLKKDLVEQLIEYKCYKQIGEWLEECSDKRSQLTTRAPLVLPIEYELPTNLDVKLLAKAVQAIWQRQKKIVPLSIEREEFSVRNKLKHIVHLLRGERREISLWQCCEDSRSRSEVIAVFLAVLELVKLRRVKVRQTEAFAEIYLSWCKVEPSQEEFSKDVN